MWGRINQMVSGEQQKIESLESQLEEEQQRNKAINDQFKKLLKEKEKEIQLLKSASGGSVGEDTNRATDDREEICEELVRLQRKVEECQILNQQKDENIKVLMQQVLEAEELKDKVEAQERVNSEKLMFELATRIEAHEKISVKLEEMKHVLEQKDLAVQDMADEVGAKEQLLKAKDEAVKKLKEMIKGTAAEELLESLETAEATCIERETEIKHLKSLVEKLSDGNGEDVSKIINEEKDKHIKTLSMEMKERDDLIRKLEKERNDLIEESSKEKGVREQDKAVEELQDLVRKLEVESQGLHSKLSMSDSEVEKLQKMLEESEDKAASFENELQKLNKQHNSRLEELGKLSERLLLREKEVGEFSNKYEKAMSESNILKDQLDKLGSELTTELDNEKKENESQKEKCEKLEKVNELQKKDLDSAELQLASVRREKEFLLQENENLKDDLSQIMDGSSNELSQQLQERDEKERILHEEIEKLKNESDVLTRTISDLEATIVKLDEDVNASHDQVNDSKQRETKMEKSLGEMKVERESLELRVLEMEQALDEFVKSTESRKKSSGRSSAELQPASSDGDSVQSSPQHAPTMSPTFIGSKAFSDILKVLEEERIDMEKRLESSVQECNDLKESNTKFENLLQSEKEKFDKVLLKTDELTSLLESKEDEKNELVSKLEEELGLVKSLLSAAEENSKNLNNKEKEMETLISTLQTNLQTKDDEIKLLQQNSARINSMLDETVTSTKTEKDTLLMEMTQLQEENENLQNINREKQSECERLQTLLDDEYKLKADLEGQLSTLQNQIKQLEDEAVILNEQHLNYVDVTSNQALKQDELNQTNVDLHRALELKEEEMRMLKEHFSISLKENDEKINNISTNLQSKEETVLSLLQQLQVAQEELVKVKQEGDLLKNSIKEKEEEVTIVNANLRSKEDAVVSLLEQFEEAQQEVTRLRKCDETANARLLDKEEEIKVVHSNLRSKEEEIKVVHSNLRSKEETVKMLLDQIEELQQNITNINGRESQLDSIVSHKDGQLQKLKESVEEQANVILRLKEELSNTEITYQSDLREAEEIYNDLQKQFDSASEAEATLQKILQEKELSLSKDVEDKKNMIAERDEEIKMLKENLQFKDKAAEVMYEKMQQTAEEVESIKAELQKKNGDIEKLMKTVNEGQLQMQASKNASQLAHSNVLEIESAMQQLKQVNKELENEKNEMEKTVKTLYAELQSLKQAEANLELVKSSSEEKDAALQQKDVALKAVQKEMENTKTSLQEAYQIQQHLQKVLVEKEEELIQEQQRYVNVSHEKEQAILGLNEALQFKDNTIRSLREQLQIFDEEEIKSQTLKTQLNVLTSEVGTLQKALEEAQVSLVNTQQKLEALHVEKENVSQQLSDKDNKISSLNEALELKEKELSESLSNLKLSREQNESDKHEVSDNLQKQVEDKSKEILELKAKATKKFKEVNKELKSAKKRIKELEEKDLEIQKRLTEQTVEFEEKAKQFEVAQMSSDSAANENELLKQQNEAFQTKLEEYKPQVQELSSLLATAQETEYELNRKLDQFEKTDELVKQELRSKVKRIAYLEQEIGQLSVKMQDKEEELVAIKEMLQNALNNLQQLQSDQASRDDDVEALRAKVNEEKEELKRINQLLLEKEEHFSLTLVDKESEVTRLREQLHEEFAKNEQVLSQLEQKEDELQNLHASVENNLSLLSAGQEKEHQYCEEIARLNAQLRKFSSGEELREEFEKTMQSKSEELRQVIEVLASKDEKLLVLQESHDELMEKCDMLDKSIISKDEEIKTLQGSLDEKVEQLHKLKEKTARIVKKSQAMKTVITEKDYKIEKLNQATVSLEKQISDEKESLENVRNAYDALKNGYEDVQTQNNEILAEIATVKNTCDEKDEEIKRLEKELLKANRISSSQLPLKLVDESVAVPLEVSLAASAPSEASTTATLQDLEWDPTVPTAEYYHSRQSSIDIPLVSPEDAVPRTPVNEPFIDCSEESTVYAIPDVSRIDDPFRTPVQEEAPVATQERPLELFPVLENEQDLQTPIAKKVCCVFSGEEQDPAVKQKEEEVETLSNKIVKQNETLCKAKRRIALLKKAEVELARGLQISQDLGKQLTKDQELLKKQNKSLQEQLVVANIAQQEMQARNDQLTNLIRLVAEENDEIQDVDALITSIQQLKEAQQQKSKSDSDVVEMLGKANQDLQDQYAKLQASYKTKVTEYEMLTKDMKNLINAKVKYEEQIETLKGELQKAEGKMIDPETMAQKLTDLRAELEEEKEREIAVLKLAREEYENVKDKAIEENLKLLERKFEKERAELRESLEEEKSQFLQNVEEDQLQAFKDQEKVLHEEADRRVNTVEEELNAITLQLQSAVAALENEKISKNSISKELHVIRDELNIARSKRQKDGDASRDHEELLSEKVKKEIDEELKTALANQKQAEAERDCERLLKEQYTKELEYLKGEFQTLQGAQQKSVELNTQFEELKQHKDLVIKKLKVKLKQTITEKDQLNASLSEALDASVNFSVKEDAIKLLEQRISDQEQNLLDVTEESLKQLREKEELIEALKDESVWLKESMAPLINKADNADSLSGENQILKHQLEAKDGEISHLKENAILKENELTYLIEQEKTAREEFSAQAEAFKVQLEEKENSLKAARDEAQWLQSQLDNLGPKLERLSIVSEEVLNLKEVLSKELKTKDDLNNQMLNLERKLFDKENEIKTLYEQCGMLETQISTLVHGKDEVEHTRAKLDELNEICSNQNGDLNQLRDTLKTRENQLEEVKRGLMLKNNEVEEIQGVLQTNEVELENLRSIIEREHGRYEKMQEALNAEQKELEDASATEKRIDELTNELRAKEQQVVQLKESTKGLQATVKEKNIVIEKSKDKVSRLEEELKELQEKFDADKFRFEDSFNESTRTIEELHGIRLMLQGKEEENEELEKKLSEMQNEYEQSINQLQDSLCEKEALYEESVLQIQKVKEMLEDEAKGSETSSPVKITPRADFKEPFEIEPFVQNMTADFSYKTPMSEQTSEGQESSGWGDASGWEDENILPESEQPVEAALPISVNIEALNAEISTLREEVAQLNEVKDHKDMVIAKLKLKVKKTLSERDELKVQSEASGEVDAVNAELTNAKKELQKVQVAIEQKDTVIAKLKLKLKQTIQGRDQLKENLQSEVDRLSLEKDVIFNEVSQKLQQQEKENEQLSQSNTDLQKTLKAVENKVVSKEGEAKELKASFEKKAVFVEEMIIGLEELKKSYSELKEEKDKLTADLEIKEELIEKYEWETSEKEDQIRALQRDVAKGQGDSTEFEEIKQTLEEALKIKDGAVEKLKEQLNELNHEIAKLRSERQSVIAEKQKELGEREEAIKALEEKLHKAMNETNTRIIKLDKLNSQFEAVEILFGLSNSDESLVEQLGTFKTDSLTKIKELERKMNDWDLEAASVSRQLGGLESMLGLPSETNIALTERLGALKTHIQDLKESEVPSETMRGKEVEAKLQQTVELCNVKDAKLKEVSDVLAQKKAECDDLVEENQELMDEIEDLKEQMKYEADDLLNYQKTESQDSTAALKKNLLSTQSKLREKENEVDMKSEDVSILQVELHKTNSELRKAQSLVDRLEHEKDQLQTDNTINQGELNRLETENKNLQKQIDVLTSPSDELRLGSESDIQDAISEKNRAFLELRDIFDEVVTQKDNVINTLRSKLNELRDQQLSNFKETQDNVKLVESIAIKQDADFAKMSKQVDDLTRQRDWLKAELDRVISEKTNIGGAIRHHFEDISSGLRGDVELALKGRVEYETAFEIHRLELEKKLNLQKEELDAVLLALNRKNNLLQEKNTVIGDLQERLEKAAKILSKEKYYQNLEQRLSESDESVKSLSKERQKLQEDYNDLVQNYESIKLEFDLVSAEKNQLKLESDGKIEEVLISKAEYCQNLRKTFEDATNEKDILLDQLQQRVRSHEQVLAAAVESERQALEENFAEKEKQLNNKIQQLEQHLQNTRLEREENVKLAAFNAEKNKTEQLESLQKDFISLLSAKDDKIKDLYSQFNESQQKCFKFQEKADTLTQTLKDMDATVRALQDELQVLQASNKKLLQSKASEVEQVIVNKGKQLKSLRNEFENVFGEKNNIIDSMRETLKSARNELAETHHKCRESTENNRSLEQLITVLETDKIESNSKVALLTDTVEKLKSDVKKEKEHSKAQTDYVEQIMNENSRLLSNTDLMGKEICSLKKKLSSVQEDKKTLNMSYTELNAQHEALKTQAKVLEGDSEGISSVVDQLNESVSNKDKQIRKLESETVELRTEILALENVLENINNVVLEITGLAASSPDILPANVHEKIRQLANKLTSAEKYNQELSQKLIELTENKQSLEMSTQCYPIAEDNVVRGLKNQVELLQNELLNITVQKESAEDIVREKFEDILGNLREDLTGARNGYKLLQEENFALKNQLDVFRNVDAKRLQSSPTSLPRPHFFIETPTDGSVLPKELRQNNELTQDSFLEQSFDTSPIEGNVRLEFIDPNQSQNEKLPVAEPTVEPVVVEPVQASASSDLKSVPSEETSVDELKAHLKESKTTTAKLKKLVRKYKDEVLERQEETENLTKSINDINNQLKNSLAFTNQEKLRYENELRNLRDEIDALVGEKSTVVDGLKERHEKELINLKKELEDVKQNNKNQLQLVSDTLHQTQRELKSSSDCIDDLNTKMQQLHQNIEKSEENTKKLKEELAQANLHAASLREEIELKEKDRFRREAELTQVNLLLDTSKEEVESLKEKLKPKDTFSVETENPQFDEHVIQAYQQALLDEQTRLREAAREIEELRKDNYAVAETLESEKSDLLDRLLKTEESLENMQHEKNEREATVKSLREDIVLIVQEKERLVFQWRKKLDESVKKRGEIRANLQNELEQNCEEMAFAQHNLSLINESILECQEKLVASEAEKERATTTVQQLISKLNIVTTERDTLQNAAEANQIEIMTLNKRLESSHKKKENLQQQNNERKKRNEEFQAAIVDLEVQNTKDQRTISTLRQDVELLKMEKKELEGRLRKEVENAWEELVQQHNTLRGESFTKEKTIQELRRELGTLIREKEFLTSAMRGQLSTGEQALSDIEYLKFQVQQLKRENDESASGYDTLTTNLQLKMNELQQEKESLSLRMATLRVMLEQEVKDHEKTKFYKEQLYRNRGVAIDKLKGSVTGIKTNLKSLRDEMGTNLSGVKQVCEEFVMNLAPAIINAQLQKVNQQTAPVNDILQRNNNLLKEQVKEKVYDLERNSRKLQDSESARRLAEARLRDLVNVLQELGAIKAVQDKLLQKESSVAALHNPPSEIEELRKSLDEKTHKIQENLDTIVLLQNAVHAWREKYHALEDQLNTIPVSEISQLTTGPDQGFVETPMTPLSSVKMTEPEPATPTMRRT